MPQNWAFLTRFCFLSLEGRFTFDVEYEVMRNSHQKILLYYDDPHQWNAVYKTNLVCAELLTLFCIKSSAVQPFICICMWTFFCTSQYLKHSSPLSTWLSILGPDYQNACKVTMFSTLYLELQHESYNMCQQCCKSGSSKIYKFIVGRLYVLLRRAHCSQHMATYNR